jgi:hypothetical protein
MTSRARQHRASFGIALAALIGGSACSSSSETFITDPLGPSTVQYGELAPRLAAMKVFNGSGSPIELAMTRYTVEGRPIYYQLIVARGTATLRMDERADGGPDVTTTLTRLTLVRLVPAYIVNNVEVEKERLEVVDPASSPGPGTYALMDAACLPILCGTFF